MTHIKKKILFIYFPCMKVCILLYLDFTRSYSVGFIGKHIGMNYTLNIIYELILD